MHLLIRDRRDEADGVVSLTLPGWELSRYGARVTLLPEDEHGLLAIAEALGAPMDFSCREGPCGTCETTLHEGP